MCYAALSSEAFIPLNKSLFIIYCTPSVFSFEKKGTREQFRKALLKSLKKKNNSPEKKEKKLLFRSSS